MNGVKGFARKKGAPCDFEGLFAEKKLNVYLPLLVSMYREYLDPNMHARYHVSFGELEPCNLFSDCRDITGPLVHNVQGLQTLMKRLS